MKSDYYVTFDQVTPVDVAKAVMGPGSGASFDLGTEEEDTNSVDVSEVRNRAKGWPILDTSASGACL